MEHARGDDAKQIQAHEELRRVARRREQCRAAEAPDDAGRRGAKDEATGPGPRVRRRRRGAAEGENFQVAEQSDGVVQQVPADQQRTRRAVPQDEQHQRRADHRHQQGVRCQPMDEGDLLGKNPAVDV
ncbi:MAG: hypothetical protein M5R42_04230 [Rhodocyclaceae bacterium]|nr:hypothetical protein [Rhodocyclaceae bacterium]